MFRILDGATGTELTRRGHDLTDALWAARLLADAPEAIVAVHRDYYDAGADVVTTASYQASRRGFAERGLDGAATDRLLAQSVALAREAQAGHAAARAAAGLPARETFVAASVGPYGAVLADGSEFTGAYDLDEAALERFHAERVGVLWGAAPDFLACETVPSFAEVRALARALATVPAARAWVSLQCRSETETAAGDDITAVARFVDTVPQFIALGCNCVPPDRVPALARGFRAGTGKPILAYPNSGETWNAATRGWDGAGNARALADWVAPFRDAGVTWFGGCCRTTPADIAGVARALGRQA